MRNLSFIAIGVALFVFTSCSNSIEPETVEINGPLKGCYEVVDKDYKVQKSTKGEEGVDAKKIIVEIKRTSQPFFDISPDKLKIDDGDIIDVANKKVYKVSFGIELLNSDGDESLVSDPYARAEALDEYEELVDQYVKFFEKAEGGDIDALSEYPELLAKAQSAYEALDAVKSELTVDELARLNKIQMKMVNAMQ